MWMHALAEYLMIALVPGALIAILWLVRRSVRREREW